MRSDPNKHHRQDVKRRQRQTIRLKGYDYTSSGAYFITICAYQRECLFGEVADGEMQLNELGQIVRSHWLKLPRHHTHLQLDTFVVMPNHVHGILILTNTPAGAGLADRPSIQPSRDPSKPARPDSPDRTSQPATHHSIPEIIRGFKTFSARQINRVRNIKGVPVWQRNYYEHIIRNDLALQRIQQYIHNNPLSWQQDQLHRTNPSK